MGNTQVTYKYIKLLSQELDFHIFTFSLAPSVDLPGDLPEGVLSSSISDAQNLDLVRFPTSTAGFVCISVTLALTNLS